MSLLQRLPVAPGGVPQGFSTVAPVWEGETVVCIASGPSLTAPQVDHVRGRARVLVCNDNYLIAPWADLLYFVDGKWLDWHKGKPTFGAFAGQKCTLAASTIDFKQWPGLHVLRHAGGEGLSWNPQLLHTGSNTGHQILNIAALSGAKLILLLGYDGQRGEGGRKHWFGEHPDKTEPPYARQRAALRTVDAEAKARGIRIVNCSPGSGIDTFEKATLESLLPHPAAAALSQ